MWSLSEKWRLLSSDTGVGDWRSSKLAYGWRGLKSFSLFSLVELLPCSLTLKKKYYLINQYDPRYPLAGPADQANGRGSCKFPLSFPIGLLHDPTRHVIMTNRARGSRTPSRRTASAAFQRGCHPEETVTIAQNAAQNVHVNNIVFFL